MSNLATIVNNILADSGIDDINVVVTTGSYTNPAWIVSLPWTKITGTPTTLAGYGITDAYTQTQVNTLLNAKQNTLTLTTTGTSGVATLIGATLNIPDYGGALGAYLPLAGGTMTGNINWAQTDRGLTWGFNTDGAYIKFYNTSDGDTDSRLEFATIDNNNEYFRWGHVPSGGSFYESMRLVPNSSGNAQLIVSGSIIKQGGTSSQYLMADGSVSTLSNPVTGTGTTNYIPRFTGASTIGNSGITDDGATVTLISRALSGSSATFSTNVIAERYSSGSTSVFQNVAYAVRGVINGNNDTWGVYAVSVTHAPNANNALAVGFASGGTIDRGTFTGLSYRGFLQESIMVSGTGTLATAYGIYINALSGATSNYSAYFAQNVGIGTVAPVALLEASAAQPDITITSTSTSQYSRLIFRELTSEKGGIEFINSTFPTVSRRNLLEIFSSSGISFIPDGSFTAPSFTLSSTGAATFRNNVGMGGAAATYPLTVYNASNGTSAAIGGTARGLRVDNDGVNSVGMTSLFGVDNSFYGSYQPIRLSGSTVYLGIGHTNNVVTITPSGRVLINTPTESTFQLDVNGTGRVSGNLSTTNGSVTIKTAAFGGLLNLQSGTTIDNWQLYHYTIDNTLRFNYNGAGGDEFILTTAGNAFVSGTFTASAIIRAGGTSSQFLKADGSVDSTSYQPLLTNPVTGTGTSGQVAYFNGTTSITGESNLFWDATNDRLGIGAPSPVNKLQIGSVGSSGYSGNDIAIGNGTQVMAFTQTAAYSAWFTNTNFVLFPAGSGGIGNLLVGLISDNGARLQVGGNGTFSGSVTATQFITGGTPSNTAGFTNSFYAESNVPSLTLSNTGTNTGKFTLGVTNGNFGIWNNATSNYPLFIDSSNLVTIGTDATTGTTELLRLRRNAGGWGNTTFKQSYNSTFFTNGKTLTLANDSNTDFAHFAGNNAGTRTDFYLPTGVAAIGTASPQSGVTLDVRGGGAVATAEGLRLGNVGDNTAYDNVRMYYTGFNGGAPRVYLTPRTTPGSGTVNTYLHLQNTNGTSTTSNNTMGLIVDGTIQGGGNFELVNAGGPYFLIGESTGANGYGTIEWNAANNRVQIATQPFAFGAGGGQINLHTSGNVTIGTLSDIGFKLFVSGNARIANQAQANDFFASNDGLNVGGYNLYSQTISGAMGILGHNVRASSSVANQVNVVNGGWISSMIKQYYNDGITFHTSSTMYAAGDIYPMAATERMRITSGGSIGIGTTNPFARLSVVQDITTTAEFGSFGQFTVQGLTNIDKLLSFGFNTATDVGFIQPMVNGVSYNNLLLNPRGGNVGIRNLNPQTYLDVSGIADQTDFSSLLIRAGNSDTASPLSNQILLGYSGTNQYAHAIKTRHQSGGQAGNSIEFWVWRHGDSLDTPARQRVMVAEGNGVRIANSSGTLISPVGGSILTVNGVGYFSSSVTASSFFEISDSRLKTLLDDKIDYSSISSVKPKYYEKNGRTELGYFAQDFELLLPSAVSKNEDGYLNLSYREVHTAKIAYLEQEIAELKKQLKNK
jgi:hypothetical protein